MTRVAAIMIEDNRVAVIEREKDGQRYYVFPGGHVESNEQLVDAVKREIIEELGIEVDVIRLAVILKRSQNYEYYFLVKYVKGEFGTGCGNEMTSYSVNNLFKPIWVDIDSISTIPVIPTIISTFVLNSHFNGWSANILLLEHV